MQIYIFFFLIFRRSELFSPDRYIYDSFRIVFFFFINDSNDRIFLINQLGKN